MELARTKVVKLEHRGVKRNEQADEFAKQCSSFLPSALKLGTIGRLQADKISSQVSVNSWASDKRHGRTPNGPLLVAEVSIETFI